MWTTTTFLLITCSAVKCDLKSAQIVKNLPAMQETWVSSLGWEDPLEKGMTTHCSILAWRIPWTEEPGGLQSMVSQTSWARLSDKVHACTLTHPIGQYRSRELSKKNSLSQYFCKNGIHSNQMVISSHLHLVITTKILWVSQIKVPAW